jgi:DNA-binding NtrC family response regulator
MLNVLVISDEAKEIYALFRFGGFSPFPLESKREVDSSGGLRPSPYDIAFIDLDCGGWQEKLIELRQQIPVVAFSNPDIKKAVEAMRLGASDFMEKPLTRETLSDVINKYKKKLLTSKHGFDEIIGISRPMQEVFGLIKKAAAGESNVLITGESGTGKELIARAIHRWSPRNERAFLTINCSAIPDTLLESELFGFEKGSFTGANYTKKGFFELADGGTLFFDEIGDVSPLFQTKILRVLQEGEIMRIGGGRQIKVDVRIITATNRELKSQIQKGLFREDLFYRLNVINIHLPPLRERMEDIPLLVRHFVEKLSTKRKDMLVKGASEDTVRMLMNHLFPGNIRELENIIEHAISFANSSEILPADLPQHILNASPQKTSSPAKLNEAVETLEKELIISALNEHGGNISRAAASLGIYRQQLQRKIKSLKIAT